MFGRASRWALFAAILASLGSSEAWAASIASTASGNWSNGATWVGGIPPVAGDVVTIASGHTVTVDVNSAAATVTIAANAGVSNGLAINTGISLTLTGALTMTAPTVVSTSTVNVGAGTLSCASIAIPGSASVGRVSLVTVSTGTITTTGSITFSGSSSRAQFTSTGASTVNVGGNFGGGGTLTTTATGVINFNGGAAQTVGTYTTYNDVTINNTSGGVTTSGITTFGGALTVNTGTVTNNGTLSITGALSGAGSLVQGSGATLYLGSTSTITTLNASVNPNTVNYNGAAQTVFPTTYHHLTLSGSGIKTLTGVSTINGNFSLSGSATATTAAAMTIGGNFSQQGNSFTVAGFDFTVTGTSSVGATINFSSATGTKTFNGLVTLNAADWASSGNSPITFRGGLSYTSGGGSFSSGSGVYTFDTNSQAIGGTSSFTITNVTVTGVTVTNNNTGTFTAGTTLGGTGSWVQGANSTLRLNGTSTISSLDATATGNTVNYNGAAQTVLPITYYHLSLSGSGTKTMTGVSTINGDFTTSGTISATAPGALAIGGSVVLGSGTTFNAGSFSHTVGGSWTNNGATFTASTGTITLNGTAAQTIGGTASTAFNNLTLANSTAVTSATANFSVAGTLNVNSGAILSPSSAAVISGAGTLTGSGTIQVARATGSSDYIGQYTIGTVTLTNLTLEFDGTAPQGTGGATIPNLKVSNTSGVTLSGNVTVSGTLTLASGYFATGSNTMIASSTCTVSRTAGWVTGNLQKHVVTGATSISYEVGDAGGYQPVSLIFGNVSVAGELAVRMTDGDHPDVANSGINSLKSVNEYWTLTNSGVAFTTYSATLNFLTTDIDGGSNTGSFIVAKKLSGVWATPTVGTRTGTSTQVTGVADFGDFEVGEPPVAAKTWDGGAATSNWGDANNWNPDGVPVATDDVSLTGANTININVAAVCRDITLNNAGLTLTVQSGQSLTTSGSVVLAAGTFSTGANTVTVKGDWYNNGGTLTPGGGTIALAGTAAQALGGTAATQTFNHLTLNCSGQTVTIGGSTTTLTVGGNLTLTAGTLSAGTVSTINVGSNWTNNASTSAFSAGSATVVFNGTGAQTLGGSSATTFYSLTDANTAAALSASTSFNVTGTLTANASAVLTPAAAVRVNSAAAQGTITGAGTVQVTRTAATADYSTQYQFTTNTLTNLTVQYSGTAAQTISNVAYGNLRISNSSGASLAASSTVSGTLTIDAGASMSTSFSGITVTGATSVSGTLTIAATSGSKSFGDIVINNGGTMSFSAAENITANGDLQVDGTGTISGTQGTWTFQQAGGGGTLSGTASSTTLTNATFSTSYAASGTWIVSGTASVSGGVTLTNNCSSLTVTTALSGTGTLTQGASSTLVIGGTSAITTLTATANPNTVNYSGAAQTIHANTYYHLTLSGSGVATLTNVSTINGNYTMSGTCSAVTAIAMTIGGNLTVGTGTALTVGGFNFTVSGTTSLTGTLDHSSVTGTKTYTGLVTINSGGVWTNTGNSAINLRGGLTHNGTTFTSGSGIYTFNTNSQAVGGTSPISIGNVTVTGVTLTNNCSSLTVSTALSGTGGLTQAANSTLALGGTSGITTLTATASPNTVNYTGAAQTVKAVTYHHLTLSGSGAVTMPGSSLTLNGNFTMSGTCTATAAAAISAAGDFTIGASNTFTASSLSHSVGGNWSNGGTVTTTGSTFTLNGASDQAIGGGSATAFNHLTVNKSAGNVTISTSPTVGGTLTFTSGNIVTGANSVTITSTGSVSRTSGHVVGNLAKNVAAGSNVARTYEVGDASAYAPVTVTFASVSSAGNLTASTTAGDHPNIASSDVIASKSVNRYWTLTNSGVAFTNYDATFSFVSGDVDAGANTATFEARRYSGGAWFATTPGTRTSTSTQITGVTALGDFQCGNVMSVSVSNGVFAFGTQPTNTWLAAQSSVITNDALGSENIVAQISTFTAGANTWSLSSTSNGANQIRAQWSTTSSSGPWSDVSAYATNFTVASALAASGTVTLYFRIQSPTSTASSNQYSSSLTVTAQ